MAFCTSINKGHILIHIAFLCPVISADAVTNTASIVCTLGSAEIDGDYQSKLREG